MTHELEEPATALQLDKNVALVRLEKPLFSRVKQGGFVAVRPCAETYGGKTFLGVYLGEMGIMMGWKVESGILSIKRGYANPAIFVPDLAQIIYGVESWWGAIKSPDDLRTITDSDINNVWYVQALKTLETEAAT